MSDSAHEQSVNFTFRFGDLDLSNLENEGVSGRALLWFRRGKVFTDDSKNLQSWEVEFSRFEFSASYSHLIFIRFLLEDQLKLELVTVSEKKIVITYYDKIEKIK